MIKIDYIYGGIFIKNKFAKNLLTIVNIYMSYIIVVFLIFIGCAIFDLKNYEVNKVFHLIIVILGSMYFLVSFYWLFQILIVDDIGISIYFFNRCITRFYWSDIEAIIKNNMMRSTYYTIVLKNGKKINLEHRKSIKKAIEFYIPNTQKEKLSL